MAFAKRIFKSYWFNLLLMLALSGIAVFIALKDDDGTSFSLFANLNWGWVILLAGFMLFYYTIVGWILYRLTLSKYPNYKFHFGVINSFIATFFHAITPGASGGQFMQVYVFRKQKVALSDAVSILWIDFILYQATMVLTVAILLLSRIKSIIAGNFHLFIFVLIGFLISGSLIIGMWLITRFSKIYNFVMTKGVNWAFRLKIVKDEALTISKIKATIQRFETELESFKSEKGLIFQVIIANIFRLLLAFSFPYLCAYVLKLPVSFDQLWEIMVLTACVNMVATLFFVPGASGGTELTFLALFTGLFGAVAARSLMLVWRFFSYYFMMIISGIVFMVFKQYYHFKER